MTHVIFGIRQISLLTDHRSTLWNEASENNNTWKCVPKSSHTESKNFLFKMCWLNGRFPFILKAMHTHLHAHTIISIYIYLYTNAFVSLQKHTSRCPHVHRHYFCTHALDFKWKLLIRFVAWFLLTGPWLLSNCSWILNPTFSLLLVSVFINWSPTHFSLFFLQEQ